MSEDTTEEVVEEVAEEVVAPEVTAEAPPVQVKKGRKRAAKAKAAAPPPEPIEEPSPEPMFSQEAMDKMRLELEAELIAVRSARDEMEKQSARVRDRTRLDFLRQRGALDQLSDEHLLTLTPDVDAASSEGRAVLDNFASQNPSIFLVRDTHKVSIPTLVEALPSSKMGVFGSDTAREMLKTAMKNKG